MIFFILSSSNRTLCSKDKNVEALYHVLILMILIGLGYSLLKDTVEAGRCLHPMGRKRGGEGEGGNQQRWNISCAGVID